MIKEIQEKNIFNKNNVFQKFEVLKTNRNKRYRYNEFLSDTGSYERIERKRGYFGIDGGN